MPLTFTKGGMPREKVVARATNPKKNLYKLA